MIRQQPITTEKEFLKAAEEAYLREDTIFVQWRDVRENEPEVVLAENFVFVQNNPNDAWWFLENGEARAWKKFPNLEERNLPWDKLDFN